MTTMDIFFLVLAIIDLIALGVMGWFVDRMLQSVQRGRRQAEPAIREARALAATGTALVTHAREDGQAAAGRVKAVATKVRQRVETTRRIAAGLKPATQDTVGTARDAGAEVARVAQGLGDIARRLLRLKAAAESAAGAARNGSARGQGGS